MMSPEPQKPQTDTEVLLTPRIIWFALLMSQVMYVVTLYVNFNPKFTGEHTFFDPSFNLSIPLAITALASLAMSFVLPKIFLKSAISKVTPQMIFAQQAPLAFMPFIVRMALLESVCLYGFVLATLSLDYYRILPFVTVSLLLGLSNFPTKQKIQESLGIPYSS